MIQKSSRAELAVSRGLRVLHPPKSATFAPSAQPDRWFLAVHHEFQCCWEGTTPGLLPDGFCATVRQGTWTRARVSIAHNTQERDEEEEEESDEEEETKNEKLWGVAPDSRRDEQTCRPFMGGHVSSAAAVLPASCMRGL